MKNILFLLAICFFVQTHAQRKPKIKGNRSVMEFQESLPPFNAISLNDDLEIRLQNAAQEGYSIEADDNLIDVLKFSVEDSTLIVSSFYKITSKKKLEIIVFYNFLNEINQYDGRIRMDGVVVSDELFVNTYESAKLELNAEARAITLNMEGNSSGDFNFNADEVNFLLKDRIDARIYSESGINTTKMFKNAALKIEGTADELYINLFEDSNFKGEKLEADKVFLTMQDSPDADVYARKDFELTSSGSSKTNLYGDPKIQIIEFLDTSELHKKK